MQQDLFYTEPSAGKSFIYRSSAGSGKTFTLAKTFLKLVLLDPSRYNKILAITFTNKAKDEMKSRIIKYLSSLAANEASDMRQAIIDDFKEEGVERIEDVITSRAQLVLSSLLHDYSRFHVSTIDHFFTRLIRQLARELKLNMGYELDVDNTSALAESVDLLFQTADKKLLAWLNDFALEQIDNEKSWDVRNNITDLGKKLFHESYLDIAKALSESASALPEFVSLNHRIVKRFKDTLIEAATQGVQAAKANSLVPGDFKRGMPLSYMEKVVGGSEDYTKPPSDTFMNAVTLETWHTKTSAKVEVIEAAREAGMAQAHQKIVALFEGADFKEFLEAKAILRFAHSYGVLAALAKCVQQYRSEHNLMFISDSAFVLQDVITESETPFIYEKMGSEISYILIDEFQDTSTYQWQSLLPFFNAVITDGGQVYVVGDVKQSIYGWRGGDLNLLLHQVEKDLGTERDNILKLNRNFRSAKKIVGFNNSFFKVAAKSLPEIHQLATFIEEFQLAYEDVEQLESKDYDGLVEVQFLKDEKENRWKDQSNELVKKQIKQAIEDGFSKNDILLLTRKTSQATEIANYLLSEGIPAISESALKVSSSPKVQLLIASLKFIVSNENSIAIAEFNHFYELITHNSTIIDNKAPALLKSIQPLSSRPIVEAIEELIIALEINKAADIYLLRLLDLAMQSANRGRSTIHSFLEWWTEQEERESKEFSLSIPESEDAVMVLTVHKAKGLEKPVVIIPYADDEMRPKSDVFWAKPLPENYQSWGSLPLYFTNTLAKTDFNAAYYKHYYDTLLESLNLLYVAFTRAGERLYINSKAASTDLQSGNLIYQVVIHEDFAFQTGFDNNQESFVLGKKEKRNSQNDKVGTPTEIKSFDIHEPAENLIIDHKKTELFLSIASEKSAKVKEGLIIHQILSMLQRLTDLDIVLKQLTSKGFIEDGQAGYYRSLIKRLFDAIPQLHDWFSDAYQVIAERQIFYKKSTHIPDRVMLKDDSVIIIDYKREVKELKHHEQVRRYRNLMQSMGYDNIKMFLIYIDDQDLVEVNG